MANPKKSRRARSRQVRFKIEAGREADGRWIAEIPQMPGVLAYGKTKAEACARAYALSFKVITDDTGKSTGGFSSSKSAKGEKMRKAEEIISRYRNTLRAFSE